MRCVIFDLDGTLADTSGDLIAAANACFRELGLQDLLDPATDAGVALRGGRAMLRLGFSRVDGYDDVDLDTLYKMLIGHYAKSLDKYTELYPGVMEAIATLKKQGYAVGICTNKPAQQAEDLMRLLGVRDEFGSLIGADTLPVKKPDPEPLREAAHRAGGDPEKMVLVGDSDTDRNTAKAAGCPSILVTFGPSGEDMAALKPDALLDAYADLPRIVTELIG